MVPPTNASLPLPVDNNRLAAIWKKITGKNQKGLSPPAPRSEPGLSRASSVSSGFVRRVSRKVVPGLPRTKTFKRQQSENREKLEAFLPTPDERRALSVDRRTQLQRSASHSSLLLPRASAPDFFDDAGITANKLAALSQNASAPQSPIAERQFLSLNNMDFPDGLRDNDSTNGQVPIYPNTISLAESHVSEDQYDPHEREKLEHKWILNLSMHFRDKSKREKFFITYRETESTWRRVTISLDYRSAPRDSLERDLLNIKFQRDKSAKIYEAIHESLQDIQFYDTVTNLKLQTADGRLHVHVVEDVNEIISYPSVHVVQHIGHRRVRESELEFDSHMSGFVYKVRVDGRTLIKKEIPGPDTIDEFLYEVNALNALRFSKNIIEFYGLVVDDDDRVVKGLLISYADRGALIDVIYDSREHREQMIPWAVREKWAIQIVQGLSDIHESGFVQGDFTLSNIVIDDTGNAKIIDINRRGCPVGWEPPEATPLLDNNHRMHLYIGVKSDLFQLGMVLWALAALDDEPENRHRPLRLDPESDVPSWYRDIVDNCLNENPRFRSQATTLLDRFPKALYASLNEEPGFPSIYEQGDTSYRQYVVEESYSRPAIRTVEPRDSWQSSESGTQETSPSTSDEQYYPPRGRSPPSSSPTHDLYPLPYDGGNADWAKEDIMAAMDINITADEIGAGTPGDLQTTTDFAKMTDELDQMEASCRTGDVLEDEQIQAPGGDSPADNTSPETVVEPVVASDGENETAMVLNEDEPKLPVPINDIILGGLPDDAGDAGQPALKTPNTLSNISPEDLDMAGKTTKGDSDNLLVPSADDQTRVETALDIESQLKPTKETDLHGTEAPIDHLVAESAHGRTDDETEQQSTRPTEATVMDIPDFASQKDSLSVAPPETVDVGTTDEKIDEQRPIACSDKCLGVATTDGIQDAEATA
ncbi:hypothetical protein F4777DRAFT_259737 [Nemania sp. FL0916]|nr:hypothetical protein F4777DRAFT_259737 [Nemania sp. FL0916]